MGILLRLDVFGKCDISQSISRLRLIAWKADGITPPYHSEFSDGWSDDHDFHAMHWAWIENGDVQASARFCIHQSLDDIPDRFFFLGSRLKAEAPIGCMNRLTIHPAFRRKGLSALLDAQRMDMAYLSSCRSVIATASNPYRKAAFTRLGFSRSRADVTTTPQLRGAEIFHLDLRRTS